MEHERIVDLVRRAVRAARAGDRQLGENGFTVPVSRYLDPARLADEERAVFRALPLPIAHASELTDAGAVLVREVSGVSLLVVRNGDGAVRVFRNACKHRGTRLMRESACVKALVCP